MTFEERYRTYKELVDSYLKHRIADSRPRTLYAPIKYVLQGGGKRIRPLLVLLSCESVGGNHKHALHASVAMEILHNFTLVHDDIMDNATARRGRATVHTKWDTNVALLVGDELLALAYRTLLKTQSPRLIDMTRLFTEGVVEVCEGQAYDKEFETQRSVSVADYLLMIRKKTGKLIAVSSELGALAGDGSPRHVTALRVFGEHVGRAFQLQDDLLDIIGDEKKFGKSIGGDIQEGKKTFLFLEASRRATRRDQRMLQSVRRAGKLTRSQLKEIQRIYHETGALEAARKKIAHDLSEANKHLLALPDSQARAMLRWFTEMLLHRTH
jgi:geranylgeranyl diphosphate synthase, type II